MNSSFFDLISLFNRMSFTNRVKITDLRDEQMHVCTNSGTLHTYVMTENDTKKQQSNLSIGERRVVGLNWQRWRWFVDLLQRQCIIRIVVIAAAAVQINHGYTSIDFFIYKKTHKRR